MRVALIADIHGNRVALDAVLAAIEGEGVDRIVCLGDVAAMGPQPRAVVERLRELGCPVVMGNADEELLNPEDASTAWYREQLGPEGLDYLRTFKPTVEVPLREGVTLLCYHGSPRSNREMILATTPPAELDPLVAEHEALVMAGGHTHVQMIRRHKHKLLVNPGSVGLPYDQNPWSGEVPQEAVGLAPWAEYALVESEGGSLGVSLRRVPLDMAALRASALESGWPQASMWLAGWGL